MSKNEKQTTIQPIKEENLFQERILKLRETSPKAWESLDPTTRTVALFYEAGRREHLRLQAIKMERKHE